MPPRSGGYGDAIAAYIRRSELPSHIYAKHQYRKESECESTVVIYIPTEKCKYKVITESDTVYYIIRNTKVHHMKRYTKAERCSRAVRGVSRTKQESNWEEDLRR